MVDRDVLITEVALRDGSHAVAHQFTNEQVKQVVTALDDANVPYIEVSHGDGLGGSSEQYGKSHTDEFELIETAVNASKNSKIASLLLPGIGTIKELKTAAKLGIKMARVATHVTEADVSKQHLETAKNLGLETVGFLMMTHMVSVPTLIQQAKLMESYGADTVYVVDSAGALLPHEVRERIKALKQTLDVNVGFHGHNNLSVAMGNTLAAIEEGATRIDGSIQSHSAGNCNKQTALLDAILYRLQKETGIDLYKMMYIAEEIVAPILQTPQDMTCHIHAMGYAGIDSSFSPQA